MHQHVFVPAVYKQQIAAVFYYIYIYVEESNLSRNSGRYPRNAAEAESACQIFFNPTSGLNPPARPARSQVRGPFLRSSEAVCPRYVRERGNRKSVEEGTLISELALWTPWVHVGAMGARERKA